ncbi:hypothetical protein AVEN_38485-1, partial [Araneus ventricosus]
MTGRTRVGPWLVMAVRTSTPVPTVFVDRHSMSPDAKAERG